MWLKVYQIGKDPIWSVKQGTRLWYQTTGSIQLLYVCFWSCMFISFCEVKESMSWVGGAFCQGLICWWLFIQRSSDLLFSMPSSFLYVIPFYVQCFKISWLYTGHAFSMYTWCCIRFPVHMVYLKVGKYKKKNPGSSS